jgi:hypothetical protein
VTATIVDTDILELLDFQPTCHRCEKRPATHKAVFVCGCFGLVCLPCVAELEQYLRDCQAWAQGRGLPHWFQCNDCKRNITCWPIREVVPL